MQVQNFLQLGYKNDIAIENYSNGAPISWSNM